MTPGSEAGTAEPAVERGARTCPICAREVPRDDYVDPEWLRVETDVAALAAANTPGWRPELGLCGECRDRFAAARDYLRRHFPSLDRHPILPTPVRLGASPRLRGRGVSIAVVDAGVYASPDAVQ